MKEFIFDTPILLIAWSRPDHTRKVIERIKIVKPQKLFVVVDGPRIGDAYYMENLRISETKKIILEMIDWDCELKINFREFNLGCGLGVYSAINWFFDFVEKGIIIEDDVLISENGFKFLSEKLCKYTNVKNVFAISVHNPFPILGINLLQNYIYIWGWGTWKNRWLEYSYEISESRQTKYSVFKVIDNYWQSIFLSIKKINTWDYQVQHLLFKNNYKVLISGNNEIENIGFDEYATHTLEKLEFKFQNNNRFKRNNILKNSIIRLPKLFSDIMDFQFVRRRSILNYKLWFYNFKKTLKLWIEKN